MPVFISNPIYVTFQMFTPHFELLQDIQIKTVIASHTLIDRLTPTQYCPPTSRGPLLPYECQHTDEPGRYSMQAPLGHSSL